MNKVIATFTSLLVASSIAVYGLNHGWFERQTANVSNGQRVASKARVIFQPGLAYPAANSTEAYDLFAPVDYRSKPYPILIWLHGGGWSIGDKSDWLSRVVSHQAAALGFVVFNINYRLNTKEHPAPFPAASNDARAFTRYLMEHLSLANATSTTAISIGGHSAGGQLALFEATDPNSKIQYRCVIDMAGVTDLTAEDLPEVLIPYVKALAPTPSDQFQASPVTRVDHWHADRALFLHARDDAAVPMRQSTAMASLLSALPKPPKVSTRYIERGGHDLSPMIIEDALADFLPENCQ